MTLLDFRMKQLLFLFSLLAYVNLSGQSLSNNVAIDTTLIEYKQKLSSLYDERALTTVQFLENNLDREIKKKVLTVYGEKNKDFKKKINKGIFIEHSLYSPFIDSLFAKIRSANPTVDFSSFKILLAISESKNVYNVGENIVVLNLPLLYELENEFQVASVLTHEIAHQTLNHVQNDIIHQIKLDNSKEIKKKTEEIKNQQYNQSQFATNLLKKMIYKNRELARKYEHQADSLGFIYFKNTFPNKEEVPIRTLQILKSLDKEKDSLQIEDYRELFKKSALTFNPDWFASELTGYRYQKDSKIWDIDSLRTHPDCEDRIAFLKKNFNLKSEDKKLNSLYFNQLKKEAAKEMVFSLYFLEMYGQSLYNALIAYRKDENELFYKKMIYQNLIKIQKARASYTLNRYLENENPLFSNSYNRFVCFCRNIRKSELQQLIDYFK